MTLLVVSLLSATVVTFMRMTHLEARVSDNVYSYNQAEILARAGMKGAMAVLAMDSEDYDSPDEPWGQFDQYAQMAAAMFEDGSFTGKIEDLGGRFNPNDLLDSKGFMIPEKVAQFARLLKLNDIDPDVADAVLDWLDADDDSRPGGGEQNYYASLPDPYPCPNAPLQTFGQLSLVKGLTIESLYGKDGKGGLQDQLSVWSDGFININTAPENVLMSLDEDMTENTVKAIIDRRKNEPFKKIDELKDIQGITPQIMARTAGFITVKSSYFKILIQGRFRDAAVPVTAIVHRTDAGVGLVFYRVG